MFRAISTGRKVKGGGGGAWSVERFTALLSSKFCILDANRRFLNFLDTSGRFFILGASGRFWIFDTSEQFWILNFDASGRIWILDTSGQFIIFLGQWPILNFGD